jgi:selenide,water dikinase
VYAIRQAPVLFSNLLVAVDGRELATFEPQRALSVDHEPRRRDRARGARVLVWHGRAAFRLKDAIDRRFLREYRVTGGVRVNLGK